MKQCWLNKKDMQDKEVILKRYGKLKGYCSPKGWRYNKRFDSISIIETDLHYNQEYNFVYDNKEHEKLLSFGKPCIYTDVRFKENIFNFYKETVLRYRRREQNISLKSAIRFINKVKGIPKGTIIELSLGSYIKNKKFSLSYLYKSNSENKLDIQFEVSEPGFFNQFETCSYSKELTKLLRENGFLVNVYENNPHRLIGECEGQVAIAYGRGLIIGISSEQNSFNGYSCGENNILYDYYDEFNKWSQTYEISKDKTPQEVVNTLMNVIKNEE